MLVDFSIIGSVNRVEFSHIQDCQGPDHRSSLFLLQVQTALEYVIGQVNIVAANTISAWFFIAHNSI